MVAAGSLPVACSIDNQAASFRAISKTASARGASARGASNTWQKPHLPFAASHLSITGSEVSRILE
jgi:hypothetical protein